MIADRDVLDAVLRSCRRSGAIVHRSMMKRVTSLATIASLAVFVGMFGTVLGIINSFRGISGEKSSDMAITASYLADAFVPTAVGLLVAIPAFCFYKYLRQRGEAFDVEMESAGLELVNCLTHLLSQARRSA